VADSGASGDSDYAGDYRFDDPVDTDRLGIEVPPAVTEDYGDPELAFDDGGWTGWDDAQPELNSELVGEPFTDLDEDRFDAFNANTWHFKPPPTPWYRTRPTLFVLSAVTVAVVALVVSVVLLAFRGPSSDDETPTADTSSTAPTTVATTPETSAVLPPPPPPPPETSAPPAAPPVYNAPRYEPRQTKEPEIGVTRTPVTRSPISVAPQQRPSSQHR
jgi:hypothetical protein